MKKAFDCVEMKNAIQRQLLAEEEDVARDELARRRNHRIETDPVLGPWLQEQRRGQQASRATLGRRAPLQTLG